MLSCYFPVKDCAVDSLSSDLNFRPYHHFILDDMTPEDMIPNSLLVITWGRTHSKYYSHRHIHGSHCESAPITYACPKQLPFCNSNDFQQNIYSLHHFKVCIDVCACKNQMGHSNLSDHLIPVVLFHWEFELMHASLHSFTTSLVSPVCYLISLIFMFLAPS